MKGFIIQVFFALLDEASARVSGWIKAITSLDLVDRAKHDVGDLGRKGGQQCVRFILMTKHPSPV